MTLILGDNKGYFHAIFKSAFTVLGSGKEYIEYKIYKYHYPAFKEILVKLKEEYRNRYLHHQKKVKEGPTLHGEVITLTFAFNRLYKLKRKEFVQIDGRILFFRQMEQFIQYWLDQIDLFEKDKLEEKDDKLLSEMIHWLVLLLSGNCSLSYDDPEGHLEFTTYNFDNIPFNL